uniref:Uncharacterized protein n=1 Tax=Chromera velia CCMP2878 TaxID=1169474 RepID=A0A0G4FGN7_9ALVE|eukprot:Cvel_16737.t1-p1 / transcript=Cvel_16737.t1 / gene=Cvel_16737 / organism=Chromera_velia_CCMP2878 / gene_product=hypothetical protein / transcript_product=hypothetical protein / location=Cvel_scaffold1302:20105-21787(+) / protein_length=561 / sequence_SO=supercontig / SO=protein_coding / is_pseudo=false
MSKEVRAPAWITWRSTSQLECYHLHLKAGFKETKAGLVLGDGIILERAFLHNCNIGRRRGQATPGLFGSDFSDGITTHDRHALLFKEECEVGMAAFVALLRRPKRGGVEERGEGESEGAISSAAQAGSRAESSSWQYIPVEANWGLQAAFDRDLQILIDADLEEEREKAEKSQGEEENESALLQLPSEFADVADLTRQALFEEIENDLAEVQDARSFSASSSLSSSSASSSSSSSSSSLSSSSSSDPVAPVKSIKLQWLSLLERAATYPSGEMAKKVIECADRVGHDNAVAVFIAYMKEYRAEVKSERSSPLKWTSVGLIKKFLLKNCSREVGRDAVFAGRVEEERRIFLNAVTSQSLPSGHFPSPPRPSGLTNQDALLASEEAVEAPQREVNTYLRDAQQAKKWSELDSDEEKKEKEQNGGKKPRECPLCGVFPLPASHHPRLAPRGTDVKQSKKDALVYCPLTWPDLNHYLDVVLPIRLRIREHEGDAVGCFSCGVLFESPDHGHWIPSETERREGDVRLPFVFWCPKKDAEKTPQEWYAEKKKGQKRTFKASQSRTAS